MKSCVFFSGSDTMGLYRIDAFPGIPNRSTRQSRTILRTNNFFYFLVYSPLVPAILHFRIFCPPRVAESLPSRLAKDLPDGRYTRNRI